MDNKKTKNLAIEENPVNISSIDQQPPHVEGEVPQEKENKIKGLLKKIAPALIAIVAGLIAGLVIMIVSRPAEAFPSFYTMLGGWIFLPSQRLTGIGNWLGLLPPLLMTGLAVGFAFKTGLFNIGASGQFTVGMLCAMMVGVLLKAIPSPWLWMLACLAGIIGGLIWGLVPGLAKAFFSVNEVITCIMMNYIGMFMVNQIIKSGIGLFDINRNLSVTVSKNAFTPTLGLRTIFKGSSVDIAFIIAILIAIIISIILNKTKLGYELKACGFNHEAARYGGISEKRSITLSFLIAGALAGLGGAFFILASGAYNSGSNYAVIEEIRPEGFDGIAIALLGQTSPIGIIFSTLFVTFIRRGGNTIQIYGFKPEIIDIIIAVIVYCSAFALLFYEIIQRWRKKKKAPLEVCAPPPPDPHVIEVTAIIKKMGGKK
ncbi:MAG: ABC transporter permease [Bacilli bacterium]|jgi:ABC-type uncharacterized transport system permease subunit